MARGLALETVTHEVTPMALLFHTGVCPSLELTVPRPPRPSSGTRACGTERPELTHVASGQPGLGPGACPTW